MPKVFEKKGYKFFFFSNEGNPLEPCHIHVRKQGNLAKLWIKDKVILAANAGFSESQIAEIIRIAELNKNLIMGAWYEFFHR